MLRRTEALDFPHPKRILFVCGDHGVPAFGRKGASTHLREMILSIRSKGIEVALAASNLDGDRRPEEDYPVYKLKAPKSRLLGQDGRYYLANIQATTVLRKVVEEFKPDAIYERSALYFNAGEAIAKLFNLPRVLEVNTLLSEELVLRLHFPWLARKREIALIKRAPAIAAISEKMIERLVQKGIDRTWMRVSSMAVTPERFSNSCTNGGVRANLGWGENDVVLGFVGSMNIYHKPHWFTDVAEKFLRRGYSQVKWLIVGGNAVKMERMRARLQRFAPEGQYHFAGTVPQCELASWMIAMDAVLVPGASDQSTPTKIFEAGALGVPVIMPATDPIRQLFGACDELFFKPSDFRSLEDKVADLIQRKDHYRALGQKLRSVILEHHTWEKRAELTLNLFSERFPGVFSAP